MRTILSTTDSRIRAPWRHTRHIVSSEAENNDIGCDGHAPAATRDLLGRHSLRRAPAYGYDGCDEMLRRSAFTAWEASPESGTES